MSSNKYIPPVAQFNETTSFGAHRHSDRPASAIRSGASSMPSAWQSRSTPTHPSALHSDEDVRNFANSFIAPLQWCIATPVRKIMSGIVVLLGLVALVA